MTAFAWDVEADVVKEILAADEYRDEYTIQLQVQWWNGTNPVYLRFGEDAVGGESVRLGGIGDAVRVLGAKARLAVSAVSAKASSGGIETHTSLEYRHTRNFPDWGQWSPKT
jgi:hypothetical protein